MKFTFTEKKIEVSPEVRAYAEKKIGKLDKFFRNESDTSVTFSAERGRYRAEVTLNNNGMFYRVSDLTSDMFASIDSAVASIERQIRKNKTRLETKLRDGILVGELKSPDVSGEGDEDEDELKIVRTKRVSLKPRSPEEAVLQMNLLGHDFFAFINQDDGSFSVVYRRKMGDYGLISADDQQSAE